MPTHAGLLTLIVSSTELFSSDKAEIIIIIIIKHQANQINNSNMDLVPDDVLFQILVRLNQNHDVIQCRSVCRRWYSIISDPIFTDTFDRRRSRITLMYKPKIENIFRLFGDLVEQGKRLQVEPIMTSDAGAGERGREEPNNKVRMPQIIQLPEDSYVTLTHRMMASCMDHLLYCYESLEILRYIIYNPLTNQRRALPPIHCPLKSIACPAVGFFCVPVTGSTASPAGSVLHYHYRVVSISTTYIPKDTDFDAFLFCSQANRWEKHRVSCPFNVAPMFDTGVVVCRGKLHWISFILKRTKALVVYDPFGDPTKLGQVIDLPLSKDYKDACRSIEYRLGACKDSLRMSALTDTNGNPTIMIWELQNYGKPSCLWNTIVKIYAFDGHDMVMSNVMHARRRWFQEKFISLHNILSINGVVAFHPNDDDLVYMLKDGRRVFLCDLRTKKMRLVFDQPGLYMSNRFFLFEHPYSPTLLL